MLSKKEITLLTETIKESKTREELILKLSDSFRDMSPYFNKKVFLDEVLPVEKKKTSVKRVSKKTRPTEPKAKRGRPRKVSTFEEAMREPVKREEGKPRLTEKASLPLTEGAHTPRVATKKVGRPRKEVIKEPVIKTWLEKIF